MLKNNELETMEKMREIILATEKFIFKSTNEDGVPYNKKCNVSREDVDDFINLIWRERMAKRVASQKANAYNKAHADAHRKTNREWARRNAQKKN